MTYKEIADRARLLVQRQGFPVVGVLKGHCVTLAEFYIRVRPANDLYINDMSILGAPTILTQATPRSEPDIRHSRYALLLSEALLQAMVLDDLANA